ncbi:sigma 54-interacting transcriptional regulator [[Clostridium] symbiosum]|uniref:sigma-54-dependent Fis family transcriptional regulator n=1 Tax=Clostridium symbiosum TaxID=1512 RepID=UPI001D0837F4|nr:sigma 54-interacting transcriptional regulator [[Clostridium] symbiosum]MCB6608711.1 sigma 54-interacting transcriptional regulator [[Clostridium] symbiosum]MCB6932329.1 sigma 54-interacting transcriptional regulator [[Clostridium] symbiosum]
MPSILLEIQETVMKYADIMSKIAQVEVEVVDKNLFRVAGTGLFKQHVNEDMAQEGYVYEHLLRTGSVEIIYNPGKERLCQKCPKKDSCSEEIEISMPIRLGGEIIGVIGLVGSSLEQKERVLSNEKMYLELLEQIADFIAVKAGELTESKKRAVLLDALDCVINHVEKGILILGGDNVVTMANEPAKRQLSIDMPEGQMAVVTPTGDNFSRQNEFKVLLNDKEYFVMGHLYDLDQDPRRYSKVLIFESTRVMQERFYEITNTVNPLSTFNIIGTSPQTLQMQEEIKKIARSTSTVLITGESGTGKELVATAIWKASDRRENRFIAINCGAIPEPLLESELFGYVKGAFTGADPNGRMGKFELANKGVIFLDEIGDMPLYLQVKLLRVIQERKIIRIGSNQVIPIDVRIIAATNKDLKEMMANNKFREDLYYRLNVIPLKIAPLRERREDIKDLVYYFANRYASLFDKNLLKISEETMDRLYEYPWYGNIRELENTVEFMINMMEEDGVLDTGTLPANISEPQTETGTVIQNDTALQEAVIPLKELERSEILKALRLCGNDTEGKKQAAKKLGIGLATLYRKVEGMDDTSGKIR